MVCLRRIVLIAELVADVPTMATALHMQYGVSVMMTWPRRQQALRLPLAPAMLDPGHQAELQRYPDPGLTKRPTLLGQTTGPHPRPPSHAVDPLRPPLGPARQNRPAALPPPRPIDLRALASHLHGSGFMNGEAAAATLARRTRGEGDAPSAERGKVT